MEESYLDANNWTVNKQGSRVACQEDHTVQMETDRTNRLGWVQIDRGVDRQRIKKNIG